MHAVFASRFRFALAVLAATVGALLATQPAWSYPWPIRPFDNQHAVRGTFDDPRSLRGLIDITLDNPLSFHSGVDIQAPDGTRVYAIASGIATEPNRAAVAVSSPFLSPFAPLVFGYWHIIPAVTRGQYVSAGQLLGYVRPGADHVHLAERRFGVYVDPLRRGGLSPYVDDTAPVVRGLVAYRCGKKDALDTQALSGCVDLAVDAYDPPPITPQAPWSAVVLSPVRITWSGLFGSSWRPAGFQVRTVDFRRLLTVPLRDVYAPGTRQNCAHAVGDYRYWLARGLDTNALGDGQHAISVSVTDARGNVRDAGLRFTVANAPEPAGP